MLPTSSPTVSVVLPVRNGAATIGEQLDALAAQDADVAFEVVVVDNLSDDGTAEVARRWADRIPGLRIVPATERAGINYARNVGARAATGELVLFCDADDVVDRGWVGAMAASSGCDLLGGRIDAESLNSPAIAASRPPYEPDRLPVPHQFLPFAVGANCGVRREVFDRVGGFDEAYVRGGADVEFFWRAQLASYRLCFVPDAVVQYRYRGGLRPLARQFWRYGMADAQLYRRFRADGLRREPAADVARAWWWVLRHLPDLVRSPARRSRWIRRTTYRAGRVRGSVKQRVVFL
jgi:glycosyltransferase involved in cell wall biosynthesis